MKPVYTGQRTVAEMDYLESQGKDTQVKLKYAELDELKQHGLANYADIMDYIEESRYGEAFQKIEEVAEQELEP